jgi:GIY-YIG catalytic domain
VKKTKPQINRVEEKSTEYVVLEKVTSEATTPAITTIELPFETEQLRAELSRFLDQPYVLDNKKSVRLGSVKWGVYAFFDYDNEPIYVGQTKEKLGTRIRRHLTNQRTDAVAMNVLDPFEVHTIVVWPLPDFEDRGGKDTAAIAHLNALEHAIFQQQLKASEFNAVLNEKDPPAPTIAVEIPKSVSGRIVSAEVSTLRDHPDLRIARRAATLAKLAQVISERKVQRGLRRTLLAQAKRLQSLAERRFENASEVEEDSE